MSINILEAKLRLANRYLTDVLKNRGMITTKDIFDVYTPMMVEQGVIFDVLPAREIDYDSWETIEFLKVAT